MKYLWIGLILLFCWEMALAKPAEKYVFELGQVAIPAGTQWESRLSPDGMLHRGRSKKKPEAVFLISISNQGSSLMDSRVGAMDAFVNKFSQSLAQSEQSRAESIQFRMTDRGCKFSFLLDNGKEVYGELLQGRTRTLVFVGVGVSKSEMASFTDSFETMEGQFVRPLSREESGNRAAAGYCWICGGVNLIVGPFLAVLAAVLGYRFWISLRNLLITLCLVEIAGCTLYAYVQLQDVGLVFSICVALCAGLLVTGGIPIAAVSLLASKLGSKPA